MDTDNTPMTVPDDVRANDTDILLSQILPAPEKRGPGRPKKTETMGDDIKSADVKQEVWINALCAGIQTLEVKHQKDVVRAAELADACLEEFNKRWM